ncbi:MAG TPA: DnaJ domain-containing protein [Xanthomonadaceae bacterium]|nr:DnaJ domain-containing protein [Xanthomonadaceae bacterium]
MIWYGKILGAIAGWLLMRHPAGAILGALIGHAFDAGWLLPRRKPPRASPEPESVAGPERPARLADAYRTLGVEPDATEAELDRAYRKLIAQYHPDRLAGAAPELRELADHRASAINAAYDAIRNSRRYAR